MTIAAVINPADPFEGCLLGLGIGDALGAKFEAQSAHAIRARFPTVDSLIAYPQKEITR